MKWPKSEEKVENGGRLGLTRQNFCPPPPQNGPLDPPVQFGVVSCKANQNRPEIFCYRSNFVTSLHAILGR